MIEGVKQYLKSPDWRRQHGWRKAVWMMMSRMGLTGVHALPLNRRWVDIHRRKMPLANLDPALAGLKMVQLSDLHYSPVVWQRYLVQYVKWVNELEPDIVVVTGDLITGGYRFAHRIATILSHIHAPHGVVCTFGNHDYSIYGKNGSGEGKRRADYLQKCLQDRGLIVLRNETMMLKKNGCRPLAIVGLDDEWSGHIDPVVAFRDVDPNLPIVCLNHNPANVKELLTYPWQWMLSGHTHGYYAVEGRHLYVNRGLSYGQRVQYWCRPEVTVFKLAVAGAENHNGAANGAPNGDSV